MSKYIRFLSLSSLAFVVVACSSPKFDLSEGEATTQQNQPPLRKFSEYSHIEIADVKVPRRYAHKEIYQNAADAIQTKIAGKMAMPLARWNLAGASVNPPRTLVIEPTLAEIKVVGKDMRFFAGGAAGDSKVTLTLNIYEKETSLTVATAEFHASAPEAGGLFDAPDADSAMLVSATQQLINYILANYDAAVGGPTALKPAKK